MTLLGIAEGVPSSYIGDACTMEDAETDLGRSNDTSIQGRFVSVQSDSCQGQLIRSKGQICLLCSRRGATEARICGGPMHAQLSAYGSYCSHIQ